MTFTYMVRLSIIFIFALVCSCTVDDSKKSKERSSKPLEHTEEFYPEIRDTVLIGDLNNDNIEDTCFIFTPSTAKSGFDCADHDCSNSITFSGNIPEIKTENSVWAKIEPLNDLNNDGTREVIVERNWFVASGTRLYVYTLKNGKWELVSEVKFRDDESDKVLKSQVKKKNGKYYLEGIDWIDGDEQVVRKELKF